jgi:hypothetical protein
MQTYTPDPKPVSTSTHPHETLQGTGPGKEAAVDSIHNWRRADHPATKISAVQSFDGILAAINGGELKVDVALGVGI